VRARPDPDRAEANARGEARHVEAEFLEHRGKQQVVLETIAATSIDDDLLLQRRRFEIDASAEQNVDVFKWDMAGVRLVQRVERGNRGVQARDVFNPGEVPLQPLG